MDHHTMVYPPDVIIKMTGIRYDGGLSKGGTEIFISTAYTMQPVSTPDRPKVFLRSPDNRNEVIELDAETLLRAAQACWAMVRREP